MIADSVKEAKSLWQNLKIKDLDIITIVITDFPPSVSGLETLSKGFKWQKYKKLHSLLKFYKINMKFTYLKNYLIGQYFTVSTLLYIY